LQLLAPQEISLDWTGDARLKDAETGVEREFTATPATQSAYRTALARRTDEIERAARRHGLRFARLTSDQPIEDMVQRTLRQVGLLGSRFSCPPRQRLRSRCPRSSRCTSCAFAGRPASSPRCTCGRIRSATA